jgi:hypothetical protein
MPARGGEDVDLPVVGPAAKGVGIDAEESAGLAESEPVAALAGSGLRRNTVNLGETGRAHQGAHLPDPATVSAPVVAPATSSAAGSRTA